MTIRTCWTSLVATGVCVLVLASPLAAQTLPAAPSPEAVGLSTERLERITRAMKDAVDAKQVAGTVTLVLRNGQVAYFKAEGAADREQGAPMRPDTIFRIASMTKAVVSVGIMMLVEEGRLSLTDPVSRYIPAFAKTTVLATQNGRVAVVPANRAITIRDLLTHTAGISYGAGALEPWYSRAGFTQWYFADRREPMSAWIDKLATLPFESQPGERWVYGYNTDILGNVIERISGQTLADFIDQRIARPLKMIDTAFFLPAAKAPRLAAIYAVGDDGTISRATDGHPGQVGLPHSGQGAYVDGPHVAFSGGAGLLSTAQDYARFVQMLLNGGELEGVRLLSPTTVALMTSNHVGTLYQNGTLGWGLGFEVVEQRGRAPRYGAAGEFSWSGAYHTTYWADPAERLAVVFMSQLLPAGTTNLTSRVRTLVNQAIVGPPTGLTTTGSTSTTARTAKPAARPGGR
ncbi:MAG: serine hydrolase domain-containing protein [Vicinamibacterales bacterium]